MGTRVLAGLASGLLLIVASACGGGSAPTTAPTGAAPSVVGSAPAQACTTDATEGEEVAIAGFKFEPATLTVSAGTAVAWTNTDSAPHTVTFTDGPDCGQLAQGDAVALDFDTPGEYSYFCRLHPNMQASITVQ